MSRASSPHVEADVSVTPAPKKEKSTKKRKPTDAESVTKSKSKDKSSKKRKVPETEEVAAESTHTVNIEAAKESSNGAFIDDTEMPDTEAETKLEKPHAPPVKKRKLSVEEIEVDITAPEPPSKKALRLLKKGKPLPLSKAGADTPADTADKKPEVEKRSEHGIWIGNLPFHVSKEDLRKFFVEFSDITEEVITRVHMPNPDDKKSANKVEAPRFGKKINNKGFAYVDFSTAAAVENAIELSEQLLGGRRVLIKSNKSFEGRPLKTKEESRAEGKPPNKRVFLGNLRFDATEDSVKEHFEKCGPVESVKVATFEDSGKCKGYAWVVFEDLESAGHAVRGYVMVEEEEEDLAAELESDSGSDEEIRSKAKLKQTKLRKWWVNKIMGRPLRVEYAEDAQVRYKKRYGKDGTKSGSVAATEDADASGDGSKPVRAPKVFVPKPAIKYDLPYGSAALTGGIVEATGKKTTF